MYPILSYHMIGNNNIGVTLCSKLSLESKFKEVEASSYTELTAAIEAQNVVPSAVFNLFLNKIYKRTK